MSTDSTTRFQRLNTGIAMAIGYVICEPKLRLGRRRHDGVCDDCDEPIDIYGAEKLDFPLDDLSPDASSSIEKLRAMWNAQYVQICLECATDREAESEEEEVAMDADQPTAGSDHKCRCCWSENPRTIDGEFMLGMCKTCSRLIEGRMRRHGETIEEAISHFEETNVLTQLRELRAEADGNACSLHTDTEQEADSR